MTLPPLPGLKPNNEGGYDVCPRCVIMWALLLLAAGGLYYYYSKGKTANA